MDDDFGFTTVDRVSSPDIVDATSRLHLAWEKIRPFLSNLAKDPHKDIHWPDRDKKIEKFAGELKEIMFGLKADSVD
jgi:hypothetical protein